MRGVRALLISDRQVTEAFSTLRAEYRKWTWLAGRWLADYGGRSQHYCGGLDCGLPMVAFWRQRERKMLASTCLYSLYAWFPARW